MIVRYLVAFSSFKRFFGLIKGLDVLTNNLFASKKFFEISKVEFKALTAGREEILARIRQDLSQAQKCGGMKTLLRLTRFELSVFFPPRVFKQFLDVGKLRYSITRHLPLSLLLFM